MRPERVVELGGEGGIVGESRPQPGGGGERRPHQAAAAALAQVGERALERRRGGRFVERLGRDEPARREREQVAPPGERLDQEPGRGVGRGWPGGGPGDGRDRRPSA